MLKIISVDYNKNHFSVEVSENGTYQIQDKIFNLNQGHYVIHLDYGFIRALREMMTFTKQPVKKAKKTPVKKEPVKKKVTKKAKKA
jgi:hypothetical protein